MALMQAPRLQLRVLWVDLLLLRCRSLLQAQSGFDVGHSPQGAEQGTRVSVDSVSHVQDKCFFFFQMMRGMTLPISWSLLWQGKGNAEGARGRDDKWQGGKLVGDLCRSPVI